MKYAIVIPDGGADLPIEALGGLTPLGAASTPTLDALARRGRVGTCATTPPGWAAAPDVCTMSLLGYDPARHDAGRAGLEAAAAGIEAPEGSTLFRVSLVTVSEGGAEASSLLDASPALTRGQAAALLSDLEAHWRATLPGVADGLSLARSGSGGLMADASGRAHADLETTSPAEIIGAPWRDHLPAGGEGERLRTLIEASASVLEGHEVNRARADAGRAPVNLAWVWGPGAPARLPAFASRTGLRGAMIAEDPALRGLASLIGWDVIEIERPADEHVQDVPALGRAMVRAVGAYDVVCCHVEAPGRAAMVGDVGAKVAALEAMDREVLRPLMSHLETYGNPEEGRGQGWRVLVAPDRATLCSTGGADPMPVPFAMAGAWVRSVVERRLTEADAAGSDVHVAPGHDLMEYFLFSAVKGSRPRVRG